LVEAVARLRWTLFVLLGYNGLRTRASRTDNGMVHGYETVTAFSADGPRSGSSPHQLPHLAPTEPESFETECAPIDPQSGAPLTWDGVIAYIISQVFSPAIITSVLVFYAAYLSPEDSALRWAIVYLVLSLLVPVIFLLNLMRIGKVSDLDVQIRRERVLPMRFTLACALLATALLLVARAPAGIVVVGVAMWIMMAINYVVTLWWKISLHTAFAAAGTTSLLALTGLALPLLLGVPIMAWSRVRLGRHTLAQTIAGGLLGILVFSLAFRVGSV
jgi:membrane-associated phospholipid phosphatase